MTLTMVALKYNPLTGPCRGRSWPITDLLIADVGSGEGLSWPQGSPITAPGKSDHGPIVICMLGVANW